MSRLTLGDFSTLSDMDLLTTAQLWSACDCDCPDGMPHFRPCLMRRIREEVVGLSMDELRARSAGLKPHRYVSLPEPNLWEQP